MPELANYAQFYLTYTNNVFAMLDDHGAGLSSDPVHCPDVALSSTSCIV